MRYADMVLIRDKAYYPSRELAAIVGTKPITRVNALKALWAYIKKNNLQTGRNKTYIYPDDKLAPIFNNGKSISMFQLVTFMNNHLSKKPAQILTYEVVNTHML